MPIVLRQPLQPPCFPIPIPISNLPERERERPVMMQNPVKGNSERTPSRTKQVIDLDLRSMQIRLFVHLQTGLAFPPLLSIFDQFYKILYRSTQHEYELLFFFCTGKNVGGIAWSRNGSPRRVGLGITCRLLPDYGEPGIGDEEFSKAFGVAIVDAVEKRLNKRFDGLGLWGFLDGSHGGGGLMVRVFLPRADVDLYKCQSNILHVMLRQRNIVISASQGYTF
jgi:hypothetical protein